MTKAQISDFAHTHPLSEISDVSITATDKTTITSACTALNFKFDRDE